MAVVAAVVGLWYRVDNLPPWLISVLGRLPGGASFFAQQPAASRGTPVTISKQLAYLVDTWFSTNPSSQTQALLALTVALVAVGALAITAVTGQSLYSAGWEALAGASGP